MRLIDLFLFSKVVASHMVLYQPQNIVPADVDTTAVISCVPSDSIENGELISWYKKSFKPGEGPVCVKTCLKDNDVHKYRCDNTDYKANLEIINVQLNDSGVYFCSFHYVSVTHLGNGTTLIVRDRPTPMGSIHLLAQHPSQNTATQLACIITTSLHIVQINWKVTGTHHKGRIISREEPGGTWTFQNSLSLPKDTWESGENVTCEVWFSSSPVQIHWALKKRETDQRVTQCSFYVRSAVILIYLMMSILAIHLS